MNGSYFLKFCIDFFYGLYDVAIDVFTFLTTPIGHHIEDLLSLIGLDINLEPFLSKIGIYDISLIAFMFGSGLVIYLAIIFIKWLLSVLP